jgi:hypothetical protein
MKIIDKILKFIHKVEDSDLYIKIGKIFDIIYTFLCITSFLFITVLLCLAITTLLFYN